MQIIDILKYIEKNTNSALFYTPNLYRDENSYFFKKPKVLLQGKTKTEIEKILAETDELIKNENLMGFAIIPYEIGYFFQPKTISDIYDDEMEIRFLFYEKENVDIISTDSMKFEDVEKYIGLREEKYHIDLGITKEEYFEKVKKIKDYIRKGDTYQINFTTKAKFNFENSLSSLFLEGIFNQSARYSAFINTDDEYIISFSPELFFSTDYQTISSKPMKGTLKRRGNPEEDEKLMYTLMKDEKNLAENVMIVDLMRNDIGRISWPDSVSVEKLYEIEKYETLYQLTSKVVGRLKSRDLSKILESLFPSGSITGAPKIRSMQIIDELENERRNIYTGSLGIFSNENAVFNIPIRTVNINKKYGVGELGLGSGIVWDSKAEAEYEEVLLKGEFINSFPKYFELLETMLFEKGEYFLLDYHLKRIERSAEYFLFNFDIDQLKMKLNKLSDTFEINVSYKVRILLTKWGKIKIESQRESNSEKKVKIVLSSSERCNIEKFLFHKTTFRPWDLSLQEAVREGFDEVIFVNDRNELLEGAISNLLVEKEGRLFTPPNSLGLLNGCYKQSLIDRNLCQETILTINDLVTADNIYICNSVKKEILVEEIFDSNGKLIWK